MSLCKCVVLHVPCVSDKFLLYKDESARGVGGVLCVSSDDKQFPVHFFSRQLRGAETHYSATELAVVLNMLTSSGLWL